MSKTIKVTLMLSLILMMTSCIENANQEFGDQHFKTAISLIELHKVREGKYPSSLDSLKYIGGWDEIIFSSVKYKKLEKGYELDLINGWIGNPEKLTYPNDFWNALGFIKSNMKK